MNPVTQACLSVLTLQQLSTKQLFYLLKDRMLRKLGSSFKYSEHPAILSSVPLPVRFFCEELEPRVELGTDGTVVVHTFGVPFRWRGGERWWFDPDDGLRPETLYYLEFLYHILRDGSPTARKLAVRIALDFIEQHARATHPHYSGYVAARRVVVLLVLASLAEDQAERLKLSKAAAAHASVVYKRLEFHLGANHLLTCAKGLLFAGLFLEHPDAALWLYSASRLVENEVKRQVLRDGCHYERAFMYHCKVLEDLLDIDGALAQARKLPGLRATLRKKIFMMANFLAQCLHPDGTMPLFGDSAYGSAPSPQTLIEEVNSRYECGIRTPDEGEIKFPVAGYHGVRYRNGTFLLVKTGRMGAPSQPGHAHSDVLSMEFSFHGRRLITDTGFYDYTEGTRRDYSRASSSHNMALIPSFEPALFWKVHRWATLVYPRAVRAVFDNRQKTYSLNCSSSAYRRKGVKWTRHFRCDGHSLAVFDCMNPRTEFLTSWHFSPEWNLIGNRMLHREQHSVMLETSEAVKFGTKPLFMRAGIEEKRLACTIGASGLKRKNILVRFKAK